jgi:hypothetical protein
MPTHEFKKIQQAQTKVAQMKKRYGYTPNIFEVKGHGKHFFAVSEPEGLVRVDKTKKLRMFLM